MRIEPYFGPGSPKFRVHLQCGHYFDSDTNTYGSRPCLDCPRPTEARAASEYDEKNMLIEGCFNLSAELEVAKARIAEVEELLREFVSAFRVGVPGGLIVSNEEMARLVKLVSKTTLRGEMDSRPRPKGNDAGSNPAVGTTPVGDVVNVAENLVAGWEKSGDDRNGLVSAIAGALWGLRPTTMADLRTDYAVPDGHVLMTEESYAEKDQERWRLEQEIKRLRSETALVRCCDSVSSACCECRAAGADAEREVVTLHMIEHREWAREKGRMPQNEALLVEQTLNAMIQFCEVRRKSVLTGSGAT